MGLYDFMSNSVICEVDASETCIYANRWISGECNPEDDSNFCMLLEIDRWV